MPHFFKKVNIMDDIIKKATSPSQNTTGDKASSDKEFDDLFIQAMTQVYNSNRLFGERLGINQLKEMLDKIIKD